MLLLLLFVLLLQPPSFYYARFCCCYCCCCCCSHVVGLHAVLLVLQTAFKHRRELLRVRQMQPVPPRVYVHRKQSSRSGSSSTCSWRLVNAAELLPGDVFCWDLEHKRSSSSTTSSSSSNSNCTSSSTSSSSTSSSSNSNSSAPLLAPVDGLLLQGTAVIDESLLTGANPITPKP